ncbi:hypothetical protein PRZ48_011795 [Zasmidium cellare]|uniref:Uncharacterized protein n=1 Tax=Zasmidium cellare TaxID=395010 RepID=A0ABR0E7D4_ZASCE|nr:hypothetical protein PRZ48_011795 [Zasmidium cellare]
MKPLATLLAVALQCAFTVGLALLHILHIKSTLDQNDADPMCLAYIYVSFLFYLLHSRLVTYLGNIITNFCANLEPKTNQKYSFFSILTAAVCITLELATLLPFAYRTLGLFITAEPMIADALSGQFEFTAWTLSVLCIATLFVSAGHVPSRLTWVRFSVVYLFLLAAPAYMVWSARAIASTSQIVGKMMRSSQAV